LSEIAAHELREQTKTTEIFMAHGRNDPVVPYALGVASKEALQKLGYTVEWHEYSMQHSVSEGELGDIKAWLIKKIKG
jgi:phospholipase/carboxylesterase